MSAAANLERSAAGEDRPVRRRLTMRCDCLGDCGQGDHPLWSCRGRKPNDLSDHLCRRCRASVERWGHLKSEGPRFTAADVGRTDEPNGWFRSWLREQVGRDDPVGNIAREVFPDRCLGQRRTARSMYVHRVAYHDTTPKIRATFRQAEYEWRAVKRAEGRPS